MSEVSLSDRVISALPMTKRTQKIVRDVDLPGFFVMVGARSKTFMVQGDLRQGELRIKVGDVGRLTTREARAKTEEGYADHIERLMKSWLDHPVSVLGHDPSLVRARHDALTQESGSYMANGCMRTLHAVYNHARKSARAMPAENPVFGVDWNRKGRRDSGLGLEGMPAWFDHCALWKTLCAANCIYSCFSPGADQRSSSKRSASI